MCASSDVRAFPAGRLASSSDSAFIRRSDLVRRLASHPALDASASRAKSQVTAFSHMSADRSRLCRRLLLNQRIQVSTEGRATSSPDAYRGIWLRSELGARDCQWLCLPSQQTLKSEGV